MPLAKRVGAFLRREQAKVGATSAHLPGSGGDGIVTLGDRECGHT
jgi:hypothetical protein